MARTTYNQAGRDTLDRIANRGRRSAQRRARIANRGAAVAARMVRRRAGGLVATRNLRDLAAAAGEG